MRPRRTASALARGRARSMVRSVPPSKMRSTRMARSDQPRSIALDDDPPQDAALAPVVVAVGPGHRRAVVDHPHVALAPGVGGEDLRPDPAVEQVAPVVTTLRW